VKLENDETNNILFLLNVNKIGDENISADIVIILQKKLNMQIEVLKSKVHRATITEANLEYVGSLTLDVALMESAGMIQNEKVQVVNANNGERIETYLIEGERGSGVCCLNGPAARKGMQGDVVIIISYCLLPFEEAKQYQPKVVFPKEGNKL
jgi:aspartate 1-decarboxylase